MKGKFIVIEGIEGAGKTTACKIVLNFLNSQGIKKIISTREPDGSKLGLKLCKILKKGIPEEKITNKAELLMFYAARIQLLEKIIKPALSEGTWIISDRHDLSSQAYQGGGRGLNKKFINLLSKTILENFYPNLTLYLDVKPKIGLQRIFTTRNKIDRIEQEPLEFFENTRKQYLSLISKNDTIKFINANQNIHKVTKKIKQILFYWLRKEGFL